MTQPTATPQPAPLEKLEGIAEIIWNTFDARYGGSYSVAKGTVARDVCDGTAGAILAYMASAASPAVPEGEYNGRLLAENDILDALDIWVFERCRDPSDAVVAAREAVRAMRAAAPLQPEEDRVRQLPLEALLRERDDFIVSRGLWQDFVDSLSAAPLPPAASAAEPSLSAFTDEEISVEQHFRMMQKLGDPRIGISSFASPPPSQEGG